MKRSRVVLLLIICVSLSFGLGAGTMYFAQLSIGDKIVIAEEEYTSLQDN